MTFRVPNFLRENPVESLLAAALLVGLLFITADGTQHLPADSAVIVASEKN